jgi:predicted Zn-dependent protease
VQQAAQTAASTNVPGEELNQVRYLQAIEGLLFGDSPSQGFRRGRDFIHPELRIAFRIPEGFVLKNNPQKVAAIGPGGAVLVFDTEQRADIARRVPNMRTYLTEVWANNARLAAIQRLDINGEEAATGATRLQTRSGSVDVRLVAIRGGPDRIWRFAFIAPSDAWRRLQGEFQKTAFSFRDLSAEEAAAAKPWRIDVVSVEAGDTLSSMADRMAVDRYRLETFLALNGLNKESQLMPGQRVKIVTQ